MRPVTKAQIADPGALVEVLRELVSKAGSQRAAADELGVERPYVTRMLQGRVGKKIGLKVLRRMERQLHVHFYKDEPARLEHFVTTLHRAVLRPADMARLREYEDWLDRWGRFYRTERGQRVIALLGELRESRRYRSYRSQFIDFEARMQKAGFPPGHARVVLAELRAIEPLVDSEDSGGIEQSATELDAAGKLKRYLTAALTREAVLLDRSSSWDRARAGP